MKSAILAASVALAGSVAAFEHKGHAAMHLRRGDYKKDDVCTVYTTVYVTASTCNTISLLQEIDCRNARHFKQT
jgi:hypothetical protein